MPTLSDERPRLAENMINLAARIGAIALLCVGMLTLAHNIGQNREGAAEDTSITLRYSWNLAHGAGPVYNPGAPPSEGYSSFLWMLCLVAPMAPGIRMPIGMDAEGIATLLGMAATLGTLALLLRGVSRLIPNRAAQSTRVLCAAWAGYLYCIFPPTATHAVSSAETAPHAFLVMMLFVLTLRYGSLPARRRIAVPIAALLVCLNRPDGILFAAVCAGWIFSSLPPDRRRAFARQCGVWLLAPGVIYTIWRYAFYQYVAPPFAMRYGGYAGLPINDDWRFVYPFLPAVLLFAGVGLGAAVSFAARGASRPWPARALIAACAVLSIGTLTPRFTHDRYIATAKRQKTMLEWTTAHGKLSNNLTHLDAPVTIAIGDAGILYYGNHFKVIDTRGLNDAHIARYGHDASYVLDQKPNYLVVVSQSPRSFVATPNMRYEDAMYRLALKRGYRWTEGISFSPTYNLWVLSSTWEADMRYRYDGFVTSPN